VNRKERRAQRKQAKAAPFRREGLAPGALSGNLYADAARHYHAGQLDEAERLCRDALMFDRGNSAALHLLGMLAAHAGNFEGAAEIMRQSLAINDHNPDCHFQLADVLRRLDQNFDAAAHLVRAIEIKPDFVDAHIKLGDTFAARNDPGQARACYERGLALDPNRLDAQYGLANVAIMQGRPDEAADLYRRVITARPFPDAYCGLGIALGSQEEWQQAAQQFRQALALQPTHGDACRFLGHALLMQGETTEALATARKALAIHDTSEARALFVQCAIAQPALPPDEDLRALSARAVSEGWSSPEDLSALSIRLQQAEM
jgi:protein O-GlcNAc transferase